MARRYELKKRAERQKETRQRITEAAVELHRDLGPARTSISAIAEKAGVQRHTFYNHFPELIDLYRACSGHYLAQNPPPDLEPWKAIPDPEERLRRALAEAYAYHHQTEPMMRSVLRDVQIDPLTDEVCQPMYRHWETAQDILAEGFEISGKQDEVLRGAIGLALDFETWRKLVRQQGLNNEQAIELMVGMVRCSVQDQRASNTTLPSQRLASRGGNL